MRTAVRIAPLVALATAALIVLLSAHALPASRSLAIWVVLLAAIVLRELVREPRRPDILKPKPVFERAVRARPSPEAAPSPFAAIEREIDLATASAERPHQRFIPLLRTVAAARLATRHGVELDRKPELARQLLGEQVWDVLRPDRPEPRNRFGPGLGRDEIAAVIGRLEEL